jgi:lipopolysaccharide transport system ATP-binding protein
LSFSISNILDPDIFFVDETIGTGDENFQKKISNKFQEIVSKKKILFLASHSRDLIERVCNKVYLFENGRIKKIGLL